MDSQALKEYYENHFSRLIRSPGFQHGVSASLLEWMEQHLRFLSDSNSMQPLELFEIGCGPQSILENIRCPQNSNAYALDYSEKMISFAREKNHGKVQYFCSPFSQINEHEVLREKKFDMVVDGHLYHCLADQQERKSYLQIVHEKLLEESGIFVLEFMAENEPMSFNDDFLFLEDERTLLQQIGKSAFPVRYIPKVENCFEEFEKNGFRILNQAHPVGWKIILDPQRDEVLPSDPSLVRVSLQRR